MADYKITQPEPHLIRVEFPANWDAETQSAPMFHDLLTALNESDGKSTLLIVAGEGRPVYSDIGTARDILYHDHLRRIVIVASGAQAAVAHMSAARGERGLPPIAILAFNDEVSAQTALTALKVV